MASALIVAGLAWWLGITAGATLDFDLHWLAIRARVAGGNPYEVVGPEGPYRFPFPFYYPLPSSLIVAPLALLPLAVARAVFVIGSAAVLAWVMSRDGDWRIPVIFSGSFFHACMLGQWTPLLMASFLAPTLGVLAIGKPHLGLAVAVGALSRRYTLWASIGAVSLSAVGLLVHPTWLSDWLETLSSAPEGSHTLPLLTLGGPLVLLALLRWRDARARLLVALSCVPQTGVLYDTLPLFLVCRTRRQGWLLAGLSIVALGVQTYLTGTVRSDPTLPHDPIERFNALRQMAMTANVWLMYLPATLMVVFRSTSTSLSSSYAYRRQPLSDFGGSR